MFLTETLYTVLILPLLYSYQSSWQSRFTSGRSPVPISARKLGTLQSYDVFNDAVSSSDYVVWSTNWRDEDRSHLGKTWGTLRNYEIPESEWPVSRPGFEQISLEYKSGALSLSWSRVFVIFLSPSRHVMNSHIYFAGSSSKSSCPFPIDVT
jgi:hypothetical protein